MLFRAALATALLVLGTHGCACNDPPAPMAECRVDADCDGGPCVDGSCQPPPEDTCLLCNGICCGRNQRCGFGMCIVDFGPCTTSDDCPGDSYCDALSSRCTPYGVPPEVQNDPACERLVTIGEFAPELQCQWGTGAGAQTSAVLPTWTQVRSVPVVADFNLDGNAEVIAPSIVITSYEPERLGEGGVLRVIDGRTCEEQAVNDALEDRLVYSSQNALADIDLAPDGRPEIIAMSLRYDAERERYEHGGIVVFKYDEATSRFQRLFYGHVCPSGERHYPVPSRDGFQFNTVLNNGPSVHDLTNDGKPEILFDNFVYSNEGCLLNASAVYAGHLLGDFPVVADVDNDGEPELVRGDGVYHIAGANWMLESYWAPPPLEATDASRRGYIAVADIFDVACPTPDSFGCAEIVAVSTADDNACTGTGTVRVMSITGDILFGPISMPAGVANECMGEGGITTRGGGRGGPPTIADFDGDGRPEFAVAGAGRYVVFDADCDIDTEDGPGCARTPSADNPLLRGVLWSRLVQDNSSNFTGSSVYDFEADGIAEVVYRDECFLRIFSGPSGDVLYSQSGSSATGHEYPVIADVDGDFNTEIAVALETLTAGVTCPGSDPSYTRGTSRFENASGVAVMRDIEDRWVPSRHIWNQHAYAVTNVNEDGTIPRNQDWMRNHSVPTLNNFRQNVQGGTQIQGLADLTVALAGVSDLCNPTTSEISLQAKVCNRGTNTVSDGARVVFYDGDPSASAPIACETSLPRLLEVGDCTDVFCVWTVPPTPNGESPTSDVTVVVDPDNDVAECRDMNNRGVIPGVLCLNLM